MNMHRRSLWLAAAAVFLFSGCAALPQQSAVKEVRVCSAGDCDKAGQKLSAAQMLSGFRQLMQANAGEKVTICDSDPNTRACESVGICQFVLGGILPGNGCADSIVFSEIAEGKQSDQLSVKADMPLTFIWTPVYCAATPATLTVRSADEISLEFEPRFCSWMVVGTMSATFNFAVDSVDPTQGRISGYWSHAVSGTGNGRGSGYAILQFPKAMPSGVNWFAGRAMVAQ
ncbi:MAG: hypothetical protein Q7U91_03580 [Sideroxyarcus sp.]|nr:hypothetical protein [Sideroxyarcus sp.]